MVVEHYTHSKCTPHDARTTRVGEVGTIVYSTALRGSLTTLGPINEPPPRAVRTVCTTSSLLALGGLSSSMARMPIRTRTRGADVAGTESSFTE